MPWSGPREANGAAGWPCVVSGTQAGLPDGSLLSISLPTPTPSHPRHSTCWSLEPVSDCPR